MSSLRRRTFEILSVADPDDGPSAFVDKALIGLIFLNVIAIVVESVPEARESLGRELRWFEVFSVVVFSVEYVLRLWSCTVRDDIRHPVLGRVRFAMRPLIVIDLLAILPFYLPMMGLDLRVLRILRVMRVFRLLKIARYSQAVRMFARVLRRSREQLVLTLTLGLVVMLLASSLMYYAERDGQPEHFGSIPKAMWWGVVTITTVGYGDATPGTIIGRILAGIMGVTGIMMFALPTAVIGAAFMKELERVESEETGWEEEE